ncbi:MAG: aminotransferase class I/II-fold pyridoxal phosphate-dependent enzyme [Muribaculaceae bacterium]|nr:aminotransferase class I/II-fold pyridoxal phosphate-dependent enzyme [Muribaculaceae bacterium]
MSNSNPKPIVPAERVNSVKEYYFSTKLKEVAKLNAEGKDIISLGIGGPDRMPDSSVIETLASEASSATNHSYQPYVGIPQLREAFAKWYKTWYDVTLNPATEIQPLIGSKEGILHVSMAFLNKGDGVLVPNPGYPTYTSVSRLLEAEIFNYDLKPENGWMPDFDELEKLPLDKIKLMWINYPHMPTGTPASLDLLKKIVDFGRRHGIVIAHDNPYSFILNPQPLSIFQVEGAKDIAIEMNSLSKSHNMAGWRIAMLASNPTFVSWVLKVKSNIDSGQFKPMMLAAVKALELPQKWYDELNSVYASRRKIAEKIMTKLGCTFDPTQQGLFLWGRIPDSEESSEAMADRILYNNRVFITPGFIFGSNGDRYIRISLCATEEKLKEALERI